MAGIGRISESTGLWFRSTGLTHISTYTQFKFVRRCIGLELTPLRNSERIAPIVRRAVTILGCLLLLVGGLQSPLIHLHPSQEHHHGSDEAHKHTSVVHAHFSQGTVVNEHDANEAGLAHDEHDAEEVGSFAAREPERSSLTLAIAEWGVHVAPLPASEENVLESAARGHDPPPLPSANPRAPPA